MKKRQSVGQSDINEVSYPEVVKYLNETEETIDSEIIFVLNQKHVLHEAYLLWGAQEEGTKDATQNTRI